MWLANLGQSIHPLIHLRPSILVHPSLSNCPSSSSCSSTWESVFAFPPRYPKLAASLAYTSTAAILPHRLSSLAGDASRGCQDARVPCMAGPDREGGWMAPSGVIAVASDTGPCLGPCGNPATVSIYGQIRLVTATSLQPLL